MATALTHRSSSSPFPFSDQHQAAEKSHARQLQQPASWDWNTLNNPGTASTTDMSRDEGEELGENIIVARPPTPQNTSAAPRKAYPIFKRDSVPRSMTVSSNTNEVIILDDTDSGKEAVVVSKKRSSPDPDPGAEVTREVKKAKVKEPGLPSSAHVQSGSTGSTGMQPPKKAGTKSNYNRPIPQADIIMIDDSDEEDAKPAPSARSMPQPPVKAQSTALWPMSPPPTRRDAKPVLFTMSTFRSQDNALPAVCKPFGLPAMKQDAKASIISTAAPKPQVKSESVDRKPCPFMLDDESDNDEVAPPKSIVEPARPISQPAESVAAQKEAQRLASERMRLEAIERRNGKSTPSSTTSVAEVRYIKPGVTAPLDSKIAPVNHTRVQDKPSYRRNLDTPGSLSAAKANDSSHARPGSHGPAPNGLPRPRPPQTGDPKPMRSDSAKHSAARKAVLAHPKIFQGQAAKAGAVPEVRGPRPARAESASTQLEVGIADIATQAQRVNQAGHAHIDATICPQQERNPAFRQAQRDAEQRRQREKQEAENRKCREALAVEAKMQKEADRKVQQAQREIVLRRQRNEEAEFAKQREAIAVQEKARQDADRQAQRVRHVEQVRRQHEARAPEARDAANRSEANAQSSQQALLGSSTEATLQQAQRDDQAAHKRTSRPHEDDHRRAMGVEEVNQQQNVENVDTKLVATGGSGQVTAIDSGIPPGLGANGGDLARLKREEKIRMQKARNVRNHQVGAEDAEDDVQDTQERQTESASRGCNDGSVQNPRGREIDDGFGRLPMPPRAGSSSVQASRTTGPRPNGSKAFAPLPTTTITAAAHSHGGGSHLSHGSKPGKGAYGTGESTYSIAAPPAPLVVHSPPSATPTRKENERPLGEITRADIMLVRWKDKGIHLPEIVGLYEKATSVKLAPSTHGKRYRRVKDAIGQHGIDTDLLDRVVAGSSDAHQALNSLVHGTWPIPVSNIPKPARPQPGEPVSINAAGLTSRSAGNVASRSVNFTASPSVFSFDRADWPDWTGGAPGDDGYDGERRDVGGKTINVPMLKTFMEAQAEVWQGLESAKEERELHQDKEPDIEDQHHFIYQAQRREITKAQLDEGYELDETPWIDIGLPHTDYTKANAYASSQVMTSNDEAMLKAMKKGGKLEYEEDDHELRFISNTVDAGTVQARVERRRRTLKDGIQPKIDSSFRSRDIYTIWERVTKTMPPPEGEDFDPELFGEGDKTVAESPAYKAVWHSLELANEEALRYFVKKVWTPKSTNLSQWSLETTAITKQLKQKLEEEGSAFDEEADLDDGITEVKVWVDTEWKIRGPRNS